MNPAAGRNEPWCLVLSGGGAKGIYHIGAWRALKELGIPVTAFVGNSIGAIVAGFLASGKEAELEEVGQAITVETLLTLPEKAANLARLWKYFVENGGLDTGPLRRLLEQNIDEEALRSSGIDLGVVTINVSDLKPLEIFLDEMEPGTLIDYLMASSAFPGFSLPQIQGKRYVDGGLWDNMPYDLARSRGWKRIILLDVSGIGWNRHPGFAGATTVYVKNSVEMGGPFDFNRSFLDRFRLLGYLDTLRAFGRLGGRYTFVTPDAGLELGFTRYLAERRLTWPGRVLPPGCRHERHRLLALLDCAAAVLEVDRIRSWTYRELAAEVRERAARESGHAEAALEGTGKRPGDPRRRPVLARVGAAIQEGSLGAPPYRMLRLVRQVSTGRTRTMLESMLVALHPELPAAELCFQLADPFFFG